MNLSKYLSVLLISSISLPVAAQRIYPQGYFRNPLDIPISLAGNFGECRPDHFHSGLDIKTQGKENMPVYAAAEGYVSRIKIEKGGFGHALYITHPEGYVTVYAHLNNFAPAIQKFLREQQYAKQDWRIDTTLEASMFPVKKGEQIAWSGNTGGSTAPHLHFEIRDVQNDYPLNPQLFGFEINDNIAPKPTQLAIYDMSKKVYGQTPKMIPLTLKDGVYKLPVDTLVIDKDVIMLGVVVNDYMNGSENTLNFYTAKLIMNASPFITIRLDNIGYDNTRYMNAFFDYKAKKETGQYIQLLHQMDANRLTSIYEYNTDYRRYTQRGRLEFSDNGIPRTVEIELVDAAGNKSKIAFYALYKPSKQPAEEQVQCPPVYLFNSLEGRNGYAKGNMNIQLEEFSLYEDMCIDFSTKPATAGDLSDRMMVHHAYVPLHKYADLRIKPNVAVGFKERDKIAMMYSDGKQQSGQAAKYESTGWYLAKVRKFGEYWLVADKDAPVITAPAKGTDFSKADRITFKAKDAITSVKTFRGELDGDWICFEQSGEDFYYEFDERCKPGKHKLKIEVADENGNQETMSYSFTR
jgi:Membrane proteins related to metalloendopeptidases